MNADTGRNVGGLRNTISLLLETRGVGLGRAHYARRVQSHVVAAMGVIEAAANDGPALVKMQRDAAAAAAAQACNGQLVVAVRQTPQRRSLNFLDAKSGEPREVEVDWRSSHSLQVVRERPRPCGYLLGAEQTAAVARLRALGVEVSRVEPVAGSAPWPLEEYVVEADSAGQRQDARGAIADSQESIRVLRVRTQSRPMLPAPGGYFVSMSQAMAGLVSAALEPDSQNSFVANRLLALENGQLLRVMQPPPAEALRRLSP